MPRPPVEPAPDRIDPQAPHEFPPVPEATPASPPAGPEVAPSAPNETPPDHFPQETPTPAD